jgi:transposase, IS5 family
MRCCAQAERSGQKWRTGCEGRISVVKRRHGLDRCRYKGYVGMNLIAAE